MPALLTLSLFTFSSAHAAIALVSVTQCGQGAFPATTCTVPATGAGNLIVVGFASPGGTTPTITSVTDNAGNVYAQAGTARAVDANVSMVDTWYAKNSKAGATTLTLQPNPTGNSGAVVIWEFSGADTVAPLAQSTVLNSQPATTTPSGPPITTTTGSEVIVSLLSTTGSTTGIRAGNSFLNNSLLLGDGFAHAVTTSPGTYTAQWNTTSGSYTASAVSFRAGAATSASPCDLSSPPDGLVTSAGATSDVQLAVNMALGMTSCTANIVSPGLCNVVTVQRVVNASLGGGCAVGVTVTSHSATLTWLASTSPNVTYKVLRGTTTGGPYSTVLAANLSATTYTDTAVTPGATYYYVVRAVNTSAVESSNSTQAAAVIPTP